MSIKKIVVKIGSSSLALKAGGLSSEKLGFHAHALAELHKLNKDLVLVSSGAVAAGFKALGYHKKPKEIVPRQASAAVGQGALIAAYQKEFAKRGIQCAQVLLTRGDFKDRNSFNNAYNTLSLLLDRRVIPIINENDTVAIEELTFGDNDMLSALVATLVGAEMLIIVTDVDGLYDKDPRNDPTAKRIAKVDQIDQRILKMVGTASTKLGTGGMQSKLQAASIAMQIGIEVFIGKVEGDTPYQKILAGKGMGTYFAGKNFKKLAKVKQWIAFHAETKGRLIVDQGASEPILSGGKSLLVSGVQNIEGRFKKGDVVEVALNGGEILGKGEVSFSSDDLLKIKGSTSKRLLKEFGIKTPEVIHRDHWVGEVI